MRVLRTLLFCGMCSLWAQAGVVLYTTPKGSSVSGLPVSAIADFVTFNGGISVTLSNEESNPTSVAQLLSDLSFTMTAGSLSGSSLSSSFGQEMTVGSNGSATFGSRVSTGWGFKTIGTTIATLDVLGTSTAPTHLIIGRSGFYWNANGSIAGNKAHNPFLLFAVFDITAPGITSGTRITSATFSFGTTPGVTVNGHTIPEPSTELLLGLGTLGLMGLATVSRKLIST